MENIFKGLEPEAVFRNFEALTRIPRSSGNEKQVSDFLVMFAKEHGLEVIQDDTLNVIIKKNATPGYEQSKTVILQGHMDMVAVKDDDLEFDFDKDPIPVVVDGDMIRTKGTTLGADNGIAVAMTMAVLESKTLEHPEITALFTVSEETGMDGVINLNPDHVKGDILINLDSEEEGIFWTSCAGGVNSTVTLPVEWEECPAGKCSYDVVISGLLGGHSGAEIDKNRASAVNLMGRLLYGLDKQVGIDISNVQGGTKTNAIPLKAKATVAVDLSRELNLKEAVAKIENTFKNEYKTSDPGLFIQVNKTENSRILSLQSRENLVSLLRLLPFGVQTMSSDIKGLVESSNNIGIVETKENEVVISNSIRSSVKSRKAEIAERIDAISNLTNACANLSSDYPEWQYKADSPLRELMLKTYRDMYNKEAKVEAIHAGLECGFLKEKVGDIDMISLGPDLFDVHTTKERMIISSAGRVFEFLCQILKRLK